MQHGQGAGDETRAFKSLDHFKRGYQERADMRDREFYSQKAKRQQRTNGGDFRDPWSNRDRVTIVYGLDCNRLLDDMEETRDRRAIFQMLDNARKQYVEGFEGGKAITALISASARRRNTQLANSIWEWLQASKIPMNVFHYNAMIAVAASERAPEKALRLMDEMTRFKIPKNEVT
jgi:pentatricopeptide repeat protein